MPARHVEDVHQPHAAAAAAVAPAALFHQAPQQQRPQDAAVHAGIARDAPLAHEGGSSAQRARSSSESAPAHAAIPSSSLGTNDPLLMSSASYVPRTGSGLVGGVQEVQRRADALDALQVNWDAGHLLDGSPARAQPAAPAAPLGSRLLEQGRAPPPAQAPQNPPVVTKQWASGPFPQARKAVVQQKLHENAAELSNLRRAVEEVLGQPQLHPAELRQILKTAADMQQRLQLPEAELEKAGWPRRALQEMREVAQCLDAWQGSEDSAKQLLQADHGLQGGEKAEPAAAIKQALDTLEGLMVGWVRLTNIAKGPLKLDLGLDRRARGLGPMVSALLDQAVALLQHRPDILQARRLEALLQQGAAQPELQRLGLVQLVQQARQELSECMRGFVRAKADVGTGALQDHVEQVEQTAPPPEILWRAIVEGDLRVVSAVIEQGALKSGKTRDPGGHTVLWHACAFHRADVALLFLRHFPPGATNGVDLAETHARNGNSLLHLIASISNFTAQVEGELFAALSEHMPEALQLHRNRRGQTPLHAAAGCMNFWVLRFAAARGLSAALNEADDSGWSPLRVLDHFLGERNIASKPPSCPDVAKAKIPTWCPLAALQPHLNGNPAMSDVEVVVEDAARGPVRIRAHRVILAANSKPWDAVMRTASRSSSSSTDTRDQKVEALTALPVDPQFCRTADVVLFALRFLYTGVAGECTFRGDPSLLWSLLRLVAGYQLPDPLRVWAVDSLLRCLHSEQKAGGASAVILALLMRDASVFTLRAEDRCFIARKLLRADFAALATGLPNADVLAQVFGAAFSELQRAVATPAVAPTMLTASLAGAGRNEDIRYGGQQLPAEHKAAAPQQLIAPSGNGWVHAQ